MTGKSRLLGALIVLCGLAVAPHPSPAQESGDGAAKGPLWSSRCTAVSRQTPVDCLIEQRAVITKTGQLLVQVTVRVPAETKKPVMMVQVPLGPFLPGGLVLDIDGKNNVKLDFQTCDANGCRLHGRLSQHPVDQRALRPPEPIRRPRRFLRVFNIHGGFR